MKKGFGISTIVIRETKVRAPSGAPVRKAKKMADVLEFVKFNALEEKIKGLVQNQASLKQRNQELEGLLRQKESDLEEAKEKIRGLDEERGRYSHKSGFSVRFASGYTGASIASLGDAD
jgi:DNA repair exonuclease SbcCD ATPase subunit